MLATPYTCMVAILESAKKEKKKIEDNPIDIFTFIDSLSLQKENIYKAMST
jgi:hypothetical protein